MNFLEMWKYHTDAANAIRIAGGHYPPISDSHNRVAAGVFQRFQNTMLCSAGIGERLNKRKLPISTSVEMGVFGHMYYICIACRYCANLV